MLSTTRSGCAGTSVVADDSGWPACIDRTLNVGASLWESRKISAPRISKLVTPSSRVINFSQLVFGSLTLATGVNHSASSFCTPLIDSATAIGEPTLRPMTGNSVGLSLGPCPKVHPRQETG